MKQRAIQGRVGLGLSGLLLGAAALASGCEKLTEKIVEKAADKALEHTIQEKSGGEVKVDTANRTVMVKNDQGSVAINGAAGGKVPDDWPTAVPIYPDSKVTMSMTNPTQKVVYLQTPDAPEKAVEFYKSKLASMKQQGTMEANNQTMIAYKDDALGLVQLSIGKEEGGSGPNTTIALIINGKKPAQ